jgi:hypothetical protein
MWSTVAHSQISCWTIFHWFSIYRFTKWMQTTNSIKALKLFFATSTKLWWVSKCFLWTLVLPICWPNFVADHIEFSNGIKDFVST